MAQQAHPTLSGPGTRHGALGRFGSPDVAWRCAYDASVDANRLEGLRSEARHRRARLALYRARMYGRPATTSGSALRALERAYEGAADRLRRAEQEHAAEGGDAPDGVA
jgi:hypothetical protein